MNLFKKCLVASAVAATTGCATTATEVYQKAGKVLDARCAAVPESIRNLERKAFEAKTGLSWDLCVGRETNE